MSIVVPAAVGILWGTVTIGPLTPVCQVGTPCDGPARSDRVTFARDGAHSVSVVTNRSGGYRVRLRTGTWVIHASVGMRVQPATVVVRPGTHRSDLAIDTGIR